MILGTIIALVVVTVAVYMKNRQATQLLAGQSLGTLLIVVHFAFMRCEMFGWFWAYVALIGGGLLSLWLIRYLMDMKVGDTVTTPRYVEVIADRLEVSVKVLDTQKIRAFVHKGGIYLSVGLLEMLESDELGAIVAHEVYHLRHSPNRLVCAILSMTSLSFRAYRDEQQADEFAASVMGRQSLSSALRKLDLQDMEARLRNISQVQ
jgi:heat shock protein HtpX